jgi:small GTP-binding protein
VGVEYKVRSVVIDETICADLQIWDTCGEERFRTLTRQYYRDAYGKFNFNLGIILIFDLTDRMSFERLPNWVEDVIENGPKDVNIILVGNKNDLEDERKTSFSDAFNFANKFDLKYIEVSALTGDNVQILFENLTNIMVKKEIEREKSKKKKAKIDRSHVSANKSLTLNKSLRPEDRVKAKTECCS